MSEQPQKDNKLKRFEASRSGKFVTAAIGDRALDGSGRLWIDPSHASAIVESGRLEQHVMSYDVVKTAPGNDGSTLVAYVSEGQRVLTHDIDPDQASHYMESIVTRDVRSQSGEVMELDFYTAGNSVDELVLHLSQNSDGSIHSENIIGPNVSVRSIGGPNDKGLYRLNGSTLELYKLQDRTSLFELFGSIASKEIEDVIDIIPSDPRGVHTNYGTTVTGGSHGGGFLPVEGKPGRGGKVLRNEFAGDIPVATRR